MNKPNVDLFKFMDYLRIRNSGVTNMFDVNTVCALSVWGLTRADCLDIMKNFDKYMEMYKPDEEEAV